MIKIHGHAILLYSISNQIGPLSHLIETRQNKPGRLFYKTSPVAPPQVNAEIYIQKDPTAEKTSVRVV